MNALIALVLALLAVRAGAAGLTDEETDLVWRQLGAAQLMFSDDGRWRLRTHGARLVRESSGSSAPAQEIDVGGVVQALAASHDASRVVVQTEGRCVLIIDFATGEPPRSRWLATPLVAIDDQDVTCPLKRISSDRQSFAVAMSPDGRRVALQADRELRLIDVEARRVLRRWPLARTEVLQLAFLDEGRRLFVRAASLGQAWEGASNPSDITLAIWDTTSGDLVDLRWQQDMGSIDQLGLLSAVSMRAGLLWQVESPWTQHTHDRPVAAVARSLTECGWPERSRVKLLTPLSPARSRWLDLAADPFGRWVAVNDYEAGGMAAVWVWSVPTGRRLVGEVKRGLGEKVWRALTPSPDGAVVWGIEGWAPSGTVDEYEASSFVSTGALVSRTLDRVSPKPDRAGAPARRAKGCVADSEGERDPAVREIKDNTRPPQRLFELALNALEGSAEESRHARCVAENGVAWRGPARWGVNALGELWLDEGTRLRRIDPLTGATVAERPTPRNAQVCSAAIIAAGQWLSWQGDTVTLRAFDAVAGATGRRVVVRRPGWVADAAVWMNEGRVAVRWLNLRAGQAQGSAEGQVYVDAGGGRFVPDGKPAPGRASSGHVEIEAEGGESGLAFWPEDDEARGAWWERTASPEPPRYRWRVGPFGSLQAHHVETAELRLWEGMRAGASGNAGGASSLGGNLGLAAVDQKWIIYDAARRERRLVLPDSSVNVAGHLPQPGVLLVESDNRLTAYRLLP